MGKSKAEGEAGPVAKKPKTVEAVDGEEDLDDEEREAVEAALYDVQSGEAFAEGVESLEKSSGGMFMSFRNPFPSRQPKPELSEITPAWILSNNRHIILNTDVMETSNKFRDEALDYVDKNFVPEDDMDASKEDVAGNEGVWTTIWEKHVIPETAAAEKAVSKKKWLDAFGSLYGIYVTIRALDYNFIHDSSLHTKDWSKISGFCKSYGKLWLTVLEQSDATLGLAPKGGLKGGYREVLTAFLKKWELRMNRYELQALDEFAKPEEDVARVRIFTTEADDEPEKDPQDSSDEETDYDDSSDDGEGFDGFGEDSDDEENEEGEDDEDDDVEDDEEGDQ